MDADDTDADNLKIFGPRGTTLQASYLRVETITLLSFLALEKQTGVVIKMIFSLKLAMWQPTGYAHAERISNQCLGKICFLAMLLSVGGWGGCESKPVPVLKDPENTLGESDELVSEPGLLEEQPVKTDKEPAVNDVDKKLLRHAVFFSFNDDATEKDIEDVTTAFAALPAKIDSIVDFQWGTNNSPENLDDGFTHGFLLTFKDETGRKVYLPHPAHTGDFADTLRPHMKDVFVIDYWGTPHQNAIKKELKHAVFFKFKDNADPADVKKVEQAFAALPEKIDSIKAFEWGTNNSPESHDDGFTHCFMVTFDSEEGREVYLPHPEHLDFVEVLKPVLDKVRVIDFWAQ